ncbi:SCAN domain-containing protein 3 [Trichonephila clavipes]|nr:SCAN domain-containing protein 3 [Trichonephila clavipes]
MVSKWRTIHISARWSSLPYSSAYQSFLGRTKYPSVGLAGASNNLDRDCMFGDNFAKELQSIPLSNDTVSRQIDDIAEDVEQQLFGKLRDKWFSIQLEEATDSNKDVHFIAYV